MYLYENQLQVQELYRRASPNICTILLSHSGKDCEILIQKEINEKRFQNTSRYLV